MGIVVVPNLRTASDVTVKKLTLSSASGDYDIVNYLEELNIYEDIFSNSMKAHLTLQESLNLPQYFPIVGEEYIDCSFYTVEPGGGIRVTSHDIHPPRLYVHELSDRFFRSQKSQRYSLDLVSEQYMSNIHQRISRSYDGAFVKALGFGDIAADIFNNHLQDTGLSGDRPIYIDPTGNGEAEAPIIIPNWHPHDALNWLAQRAYPIGNKFARNYLYFESMNGSHFQSLNHLMSVEPVLTFGLEQRVDDPEHVEALSGGYVKADRISFDNSFKKVKNTKRGLYASKLITHDIVKKKILQHDYYGINDKKDNIYLNTNHVSKNESFSNNPVAFQAGNTFNTSFAPSPINPGKIDRGNRLIDFTDSCIEFYPKHDKMYAINSQNNYDNKVEEWKQIRHQQMQRLDGYTIIIECSGLSFLRLGTVIFVYVPSPETISHGDRTVINDKFMSGKYLVTAIQHVITQGKHGDFQYKMRIEATKDGIDGNIPNRSLVVGRDILR